MYLKWPTCSMDPFLKQFISVKVMKLCCLVLVKSILAAVVIKLLTLMQVKLIITEVIMKLLEVIQVWLVNTAVDFNPTKVLSNGEEGLSNDEEACDHINEDNFKIGIQLSRIQDEGRKVCMWLLVV